MPSDTHVDLKNAATGLLVRAESLKPVLAGRTPKADELRRVPDETIADFQRGRASSACCSPSRWGGLRGRPAARSSTCR